MDGSGEAQWTPMWHSKALFSEHHLGQETLKLCPIMSNIWMGGCNTQITGLNFAIQVIETMTHLSLHFIHGLLASLCNTRSSIRGRFGLRLYLGFRLGLGSSSGSRSCRSRDPRRKSGLHMYIWGYSVLGCLIDILSIVILIGLNYTQQIYKI